MTRFLRTKRITANSSQMVKETNAIRACPLAVHERALTIKDKSVSNHQKNLQFLPTEIFRVKNGVSTGLTEEIFQFVDIPSDFLNNSTLLKKGSTTIFFRIGKSLF